MARSPSPEPAIPPARLVALGDGVFAIVMTLLVFQLSVPVARGDEALGGALLDMWPEFAVYALSFMVLGVFWLIHHVLFDLVERYDTTLIWLNLGFLMFASLVPFSTNLFAEHGATIATAVFYGMNMTVVFAGGWGIFLYATHRGRLVADDLDPAVVTGGRLMGVVYMGFMLPSLATALISPVISFSLYGVMVLVIIVATVAGRSERVLLWPSRASAAGDGIGERSEPRVPA